MRLATIEPGFVVGRTCTVVSSESDETAEPKTIGTCKQYLITVPYVDNIINAHYYGLAVASP